MPLISRLFTAAMLVVPPADSVVVHGWPDDEENALRVALEIADRLPPGQRVTVVCEDPERAASWSDLVRRSRGDAGRLPVFLRKASLRGRWCVVRARVLLSTHQLMGNPVPRRGRLHVLLGHGHGPKNAAPAARRVTFGHQLTVTNTTTWGFEVARDQGFDLVNGVAAVGIPREDAFDEASDRSRLSALGLDPDRPLVLWLPTYRHSRRADVAWDDGDSVATHVGYEHLVSVLARRCEDLGVQLVTKSHPLDGAPARWNLAVVDQEGLFAAGVTFYRLLTMADAVVADYSSVWVDHLSADSSTALLIPDVEEYAHGRGLNRPLVSEVAHDLVLHDESTVDEFVRALAAGDRWRSAERARLSADLGLVPAPAQGTRTAAVVDAIAVAGARLGVPLPFRSR